MTDGSSLKLEIGGHYLNSGTSNLIVEGEVGKVRIVQ